MSEFSLENFENSFELNVNRDFLINNLLPIINRLHHTVFIALKTDINYIKVRGRTKKTIYHKTVNRKLILIKR